MVHLEPPKERKRGFAGKCWRVHKFGGTSVANAECFRHAATIVEQQQLLEENQAPTHLNMAVVVSAMGGTPKVTDLLLSTVVAAAARNQDEVEATLQLILEKHTTCLQELFSNETTRNRLVSIIQQDLENVRDILKTVSLMKWQATRISELIAGNGEIWSSQILCALLQERARVQRNNTDEFVFLDARRVITIDEEAVQDGAVCWDICQEKLEQVYQEEQANMSSPEKTMHLVITGYVASNTHGVATTLQRDGSDYSAAIMGKLLNSESITIWTDVDGVLSADPRRVPSAHVIPEVSFNEAMELAYFGAKVSRSWQGGTVMAAFGCSIQISILHTLVFII